MTPDLLMVYGDRPQWVPSPDGRGRDCVAIHDQEHLRQRREWKRKRAEAHDDAGGFTFRRVQKAYTRWMAEETAWYRRRGLDVPGFGQRVVAPVPVPRVGKKSPATVQRLLTSLSDGQIHTAEACATALQMTRSYVATAICRLRKRGYDIVWEPTLGSRPAGYRYRGASSG
jgi:biotin operon repressor